MNRAFREETTPRGTVARRSKRVRRLHVVLWLVVAWGIVYGLDWPRMVRFNGGLDHTFLIDALLILAPLVLPLLLSQAAFYDADRAAFTAAHGRAPVGNFLASRAGYLAFHVRNELGLLLLPVLILLAAQDAAEWLLPEATESTRAGLLFAPLAALVVLAFPLLLRHLWGTHPLEPGPLRQCLERCAHRAGLRMRDILVWETDGMIVNAAVTGIFPQVRYVFLTDGLLAELSEDEIEAVFAHELGHLRHRHMLLRIAAVLAPFSLGILLLQIWPRAAEWIVTWFHWGGPTWQAPWALLALTGMGAYVLLAFGFLSRALEHQADLFGCRMIRTGSKTVATEIFISALEKLGKATGGRHVRTWQHASIARRVAFLRQALESPGHARRFHRRVHLIGILIALMSFGPLGSLLARV